MHIHIAWINRLNKNEAIILELVRLDYFIFGARNVCMQYSNYYCIDLKS